MNDPDLVGFWGAFASGSFGYMASGYRRWDSDSGAYISIPGRVVRFSLQDFSKDSITVLDLSADVGSE